MKNVHKLLIALIPSALMLGCGGNGASSNDQGVSVSFLGLFQTVSSASSPSTGTSTNNQSNLTGCGQLPQALAGGFISLGQTFLDPTATPLPGFVGLTVDPSGAVYAAVGIQNNMYGQVFRADRVLLNYYIPGSSVQPPSTNVAVNLLAGPAEAGLGTNTTTGGTAVQTGTNLRRPVVTSLPPTFNQICNRAFAQVPIIPSPVREWLNFNSNQLPEAPFDLEVIVQLTGLSSGGNRYDTNEALFTFSVLPEIQVVPPTPVTTTTVGQTSNSNTTTTLSVKGDASSDGEAQGLDELERAFETESVVEGE